MALITVGSGVPEDQLAPDMYAGTLTKVEQKTITVEDKEKEVYEWTFEVGTVDANGNPGEPQVVSGLTSSMTGPQSKTFAFLSALLGAAAVAPGATFEMGDLVGKTALIEVSLNKGGYAKVSDAKPLPAAMRAPLQAQAAATPVAAPVAAAAPAAAEGDDLPF